MSGTGKVNILLIGSDARLGLDGARSDSMIMLTFDRDNKQIKLLSFMRDMYVAIPGHSSTKLNAAFNYGGESLLTETLRNNFDVALETYITIRFENFIAVVDQIGGIDLYLTQKEIDYINAEIGGIPDGEGVKHLTGAQTLSHTRNRRVGNGDFTRTAASVPPSRRFSARSGTRGMRPRWLPWSVIRSAMSRPISRQTSS
ncbi:MAG: LCP family protein [Clostridiales bacterium]|nr:LCP family protein [Clostridiales bacterium]